MTRVALFYPAEIDWDRQYKSVVIKRVGKKIGQYRYTNHKQCNEENYTDG
jgi:hypothetical protein